MKFLLAKVLLKLNYSQILCICALVSSYRKQDMNHMHTRFNVTSSTHITYDYHTCDWFNFHLLTFFLTLYKHNEIDLPTLPLLLYWWWWCCYCFIDIYFFGFLLCNTCDFDRFVLWSYFEYHLIFRVYVMRINVQLCVCVHSGVDFICFWGATTILFSFLSFLVSP